MQTQFSTTEICSSPPPFGWKFESNLEKEPDTDPPDNQGGGGTGGTTSSSTTTTKPAPREEEAPEGGS